MTSGIHAQHVQSTLSQKSIYLCIVVSPWKALLSSKDRDKDCNIYTLSLESCMAKLGETLLNHRVRKVQTTTTIPAASCFKFVEKKVLTSRPSPFSLTKTKQNKTNPKNFFKTHLKDFNGIKAMLRRNLLRKYNTTFKVSKVCLLLFEMNCKKVLPTC